jgi:hypothetical protein
VSSKHVIIGDPGVTLTEMSKQKQWKRIGGQAPDEVLDLIVARATYCRPRSESASVACRHGSAQFCF